MKGTEFFISRIRYHSESGTRGRISDLGSGKNTPIGQKDELVSCIAGKVRSSMPAGTRVMLQVHHTLVQEVFRLQPLPASQWCRVTQDLFRADGERSVNLSHGRLSTESSDGQCVG